MIYRPDERPIKKAQNGMSCILVKSTGRRQYYRRRASRQLFDGKCEKRPYLTRQNNDQGKSQRAVRHRVGGAATTSEKFAALTEIEGLMRPKNGGKLGDERNQTALVISKNTFCIDRVALTSRQLRNCREKIVGAPSCLRCWRILRKRKASTLLPVM